MLGICPLRVVMLVTILAQGCTTDSPSTSDVSIVGGRNAEYQSFMVAIRDAKDNGQFCGGSWIDEGVIITAAHCIHGQTPKLAVTVGSTDKNEFSRDTTFRVRSVVIHPDFNPERDMKNDIALLFIDPIDRSKLPRDVSAIKMNSDRGIPSVGDTVSPIGWGNESSFGALFRENLQQEDVPVVANATCRQGGKYYNLIEDDYELCAGHFELGGSDSCQGDSGGPLIKMVGGQPVLVGIVSWGMDCAQKKRPGVYTRLSKHVDWVKKEIESQRKPVALESAALAKTVASACYASFTGTDLISGVPYSFNYRPGTLKKVDAPPGHGRSLRNCSFNREGLGLVNVTVAPIDEKPYFFVKLNGETWVGDATATFEVDVDCETSNDSFLVAKYTSSVAMIFNDQKFLSAGVAQPSGTPRESISCKTSHIELSYRTYGGSGQQTEKRYLTVAFPQGGAAPITYLMEIDDERIAGESGLRLTHEFTDPTHAKVKFEHRGDFDIFTWVLSCPFKYQLVSEDGTVHRAEIARASDYQVAFHHGVSRSAVIAEGNGVKFEMIFNTPSTAGKLENCTVNELSLDVE